MTDELWLAAGKGRWRHIERDRFRWATSIADIVVHGPTEWHLFVNTMHVATFNSWAEARDATPMMIKLHGQESQS